MRNKLIATLLLSTTLLIGCGSDEPTTSTDKNDSKVEATTKEARAKDADGNETVVTITFEGDKATGIEIDVIQADGSSKYEAAESGAYAMNGPSGNEWHTQVDLLEASIVENNFDLSKVTLTDDGKTDAVSGVSITVSSYLDVVKEALAK